MDERPASGGERAGAARRRRPLLDPAGSRTAHRPPEREAGRGDHRPPARPRTAGPVPRGARRGRCGRALRDRAGSGRRSRGAPRRRRGGTRGIEPGRTLPPLPLRGPQMARGGDPGHRGGRLEPDPRDR